MLTFGAWVGPAFFLSQRLERFILAEHGLGFSGNNKVRQFFECSFLVHVAGHNFGVVIDYVHVLGREVQVGGNSPKYILRFLSANSQSRSAERRWDFLAGGYWHEVEKVVKFLFS